MSAEALRIALRADASASIGLGHVKRCLALAEALREAGATVCLVTRDLGLGGAVLAAPTGIETMTLRAGKAPAPWREDAEETSAALRAWRPHWLVVDHYGYDARWEVAAGSALGARIAAIDDLADRDHAVDLLIDHNHDPDHRAKYADRIAPGTGLLCGPRYALLSGAYADAPRYGFHPDVRSIGIFMGGADAAGLSGVVVQACRELARFEGLIEVVTTRANPALAQLAETCRRWPDTRLSTDLPDLAGFFARHDLQIGAGGGAAWERCCIGPPTLGLICAANQRVVIPQLANLGVLATPQADRCDPEAIGTAVQRLLGDPVGRERLSERSRQLVDGLGARRVALWLAAPGLRVRAASPADARMIHAWRNHPMTRAMSHDDSEIPLPEHLAWLDRTLADPSRMLLLACVGRIPVGVIRFDRSHDSALVSLYLDPTLHGLGLGSAMLAEGERFAARRAAPPARYVATVLPGNAASQRMFQQAGYRPETPEGVQWSKTGPGFHMRRLP